MQIFHKVKYPYILDKNHYFTKLIIAHHHKLVKHNGIRETLNATRAGYWILQGRSMIRKFVFNCSICKKNEGKPNSYPQHSNLTKERLSESHASLNVSTDYAEPLCIINIYHSDSNDMYKAWLVIIPCASSRGIYF